MTTKDEEVNPRDRAAQFDSFIREALEQKYLAVYGTTALLPSISSSSCTTSWNSTWASTTRRTKIGSMHAQNWQARRG